MKMEVTCSNEDCAFRPPAQFLDFGPYRHLVEAPSIIRLLDVKCPTCGRQALKLLRPVPDDHLFALGKMVATSAAMELFADSAEVSALVSRHVAGDYGELDEHDAAQNAVALEYTDGLPNGRILSVYTIKGERIYIITEHGRQSTTVMLANEY